MRCGLWLGVALVLLCAGARVSTSAQTGGAASAQDNALVNDSPGGQTPGAADAETVKLVQPKQIGGNVLPPKLIHSVEPKFSDTAKAEKIGGQVLVGVWIDERGLPVRVWIVRGIGYGLDETAIDAIKQYRFKPATENGKPVLVRMNVMVNFQIKGK